jgi:hypothetical protein
LARRFDGDVEDFPGDVHLEPRERSVPCAL